MATGLKLTCSWLAVLAILIFSAVPSGAAPGVIFVGSQPLTTDLAFTDNVGTGNPIVLTNATFPDGGTKAFAAILFNYDGTTSFSCGASCPDGPNANDYCHAYSLGPYSCAFQSNPVSCATYMMSFCYSVDNGASELHQVVTQNGGSVTVDGGPHIFSGIEPGPVQPDGTTLHLALRNLASTTSKVVLYVNNGPGRRATNACFTLSDSAGSSSGLATVAAGGGEFLEWAVAPAPGQYNADLYESTDACGTGKSTYGNVIVGGLFFKCSEPTVAAASRLSMVHHGRVSVVRWYSAQHVAGFNVFDGSRLLNHRLVTSQTHWYRFATNRTIHRLRLVPVGLSG